MTNITALNVEETAVVMPPLGHKVKRGNAPHYWHQLRQEKQVKKAELKAGVAYYATSRNNYMHTYHKAIYKTHKQHESNRFWVVFDKDGQPRTGYRSASVIYMTNCPTYGHGCLRHKKEGSDSINCYITDFRLMDIRGEYWALIKHMQDQYNAKPSKDIRAERLVRIAKRNQYENDAPIKEEFYRVLSQITGGHCSSYDRLGGFNVEEMQKITNAIKASMPSVMAVAS